MLIFSNGSDIFLSGRCFYFILQISLIYYSPRQSIIRSNLQYAALSALRRLPLDPGNPVFLHRAVQGLVLLFFGFQCLIIRHYLCIYRDNSFNN